MDERLGATLYVASTWVIPVLLAITLHEAAHGFVAWRRGDETAWRLGRVTFNPLKHIDPFGTIALPALLLLLQSPFLFGYAKPVPVNFRALRNPRWDMVLVAAAGPATNILLALTAGATSLLLAPAMHALSRAHERRADRYALAMTGNPEAFISAMRKLAASNLAEDRPGRVVEMLFHSHPSTSARVAAALEWQKEAPERGPQEPRQR